MGSSTTQHQHQHDQYDHLLLFPFSAHGHVIPFFNLALNLVSSSSDRRTITISFLCTRNVHRWLLHYHTSLKEHGLHGHLRFLIFPEQEEEEDVESGASMPGMMQRTLGDGMDALLAELDWLHRQKGAIEKMILHSSHQYPPISCMVVDCLFPWTREIACRIGARWCVFWTASPPWLRKSAMAAATTTATDGVDVDVNGYLRFIGVSIVARWSDYNRDRCRNMALADCLLLNTSREIDDTTPIPTMETTHVRTIGPLLPPPTMSALNDDDNIIMESLAWLDIQPPSSVIYISFGSVVELSEQQLVHLALGIEATRCRFLWVLRNQFDNLHKLPKGFLNNNRGRVVAWAPQLRVLRHPAITYFLTHCGWNSVVESITVGVPMLCMPFFGDQFLNSNKVVKEWGIGLPLSRNTRDKGGSNKEETIVENSEIEKVLRVAMEEETSKHFKRKSADLAESVRTSLEKGGSSYENMMEFFHIISTK